MEPCRKNLAEKLIPPSTVQKKLEYLKLTDSWKFTNYQPPSKKAIAGIPAWVHKMNPSRNWDYSENAVPTGALSRRYLRTVQHPPVGENPSNLPTKPMFSQP